MLIANISQNDTSYTKDREGEIWSEMGLGYLMVPTNFLITFIVCMKKEEKKWKNILEKNHQ